MRVARCPRLRMMLSVELGARRGCQDVGLPTAERGVLLREVEKISSRVTPSRQRASEIAISSAYRVPTSCQFRQGLLATFFLYLCPVVKNVDSQSCPTCPSRSVWSIALFCPTVNANFPQRCRVLRPTLVLLTNCLLYVCSSIDFLTRPRL